MVKESILEARSLIVLNWVRGWFFKANRICKRWFDDDSLSIHSITIYLLSKAELIPLSLPSVVEDIPNDSKKKVSKGSYREGPGGSDIVS